MPGYAGPKGERGTPGNAVVGPRGLPGPRGDKGKELSLIEYEINNFNRYFIWLGEIGSPGRPGRDGEKGSKGEPAGVHSVYHFCNNLNCTLKYSFFGIGAVGATIKGEKGSQGLRGEKGDGGADGDKGSL